MADELAEPKANLRRVSVTSPTNEAGTFDKRRFANVSGLSQRARLAIALHLFESYCDKRGLAHPEIDAYLEKMWEFIRIYGNPDAFGRWAESRNVLIEVGLGEFCPPEIQELLSNSGVPEHEFRSALELTTEVLYVSMYGATNEKLSRQFVQKLADLVSVWNVEWPDTERLAFSQWTSGNGWGEPPSEKEFSEWRKK